MFPLNQCFVCSLFQDHPKFKGLKGLCQFLQFIPLPDEVLDFFKPVAGQIIQLLKGKAFLPTLSSSITHTHQNKQQKQNKNISNMLWAQLWRTINRKHCVWPYHCSFVLSLPAGEVVFKLPSQVAVCQDAVIRDVIGGAELERHLSLSYLHPGLSLGPSTSLLTHLGVRYLRGSDVSTVTTAMAKELRVEGIHSGVWKR